MYILIDRERMVLLHKGKDVQLLANLAWIECHTAPYYIFDMYDASGFRDFTDMELKILYRNITGQDNHSFNRRQLLQVLHSACVRVGESDALAFEADLQAEYVKEGDMRKWVYVKGASRPAMKPELFEPACKRAKRSKQEEAEAIAGKLPALKHAIPATSPHTGENTAKTTAMRSSTASNGPKRGTAKAIIWAIADEMWKEAAMPTSKVDVLSLRKAIMGRLEVEEQIKRASSSSELGQWHKVRAPF